MMTVPENNNYNEDSRNNNTDNNNELQGFHDLPKFLQFGLKYTASRYKKSYIAIQFLVQFGLIPIFGYMTKSLPFSVILSTLSIPNIYIVSRVPGYNILFHPWDG